MLKTNLIFVEGIPGTGKSSTMHLLGLHLSKLGHDVSWHFEGDPNNPAFDYSQWESAYDQDLSLEEKDRIMHNSLSCWSDLVTPLVNTGKIILLDGHLFQAAVLFQLLLNQSIEKARTYILDVIQITAPLNPLLIYLHRPDVKAGLENTLSVRTNQFADYLIDKFRATPYGKNNKIQHFADVIEVYKIYQNLTNHLFETLEIQKLGIDSSAGEWNKYNHQLTRFLGIDHFEFPGPRENELETFTGQYQATGSLDKLTVKQDRNGLTISNQAILRLIPKNNHTFYTLGTGIELQFKSDKNGTPHFIEVTGEKPDSTSIWNRLEIDL
jgi:thymidylate kinase